ncbi:hypothetical protein [Gordonia sp. UBA7599]|uniref:hypothetical protein n=1 Tax=Gordonia sp. UBA7599 TaxID=1946578 RepID=UPI0025BFC4BD|nr:hypothetical protein [Gordonia sp. UBA7599]
MERQQWRIQNRLQEKSNRLLSQQNMLSASQVALQTQIHAAQEEGNQIALASLQMQKQQLDLQIMQLEGQKQQFEQAAEHQARVDMQSFAQWRQTPDGRAFMQWATAADGVVQTIEDRNQQWLAAWNEWIKSEVSDAEVTAHRALTELPEQISAELSRSVLKFKLPTLKRYVWWIIGIAVVSAIVASVGTILIPVVLGALAYYVWATKRRNARLSELREDLIDAQETQRVRVTRLGFDPLDHDAPVEKWTPVDTAQKATKLLTLIDDGIRVHSHPSDLPVPRMPVVTDPTTLRVAPLRALAEKWSSGAGAPAPAQLRRSAPSTGPRPVPRSTPPAPVRAPAPAPKSDAEPEVDVADEAAVGGGDDATQVVTPASRREYMERRTAREQQQGDEEA